MAASPQIDVAYEADEAAQRIVDENPDGARLEAIGHLYGVTRERIRQVETVAMTKYRLALLIADEIGIERAEPILLRLRGMPPHVYWAELRRLRGEPEVLQLPSSAA